MPSANEPGAAELGVKFRSDVDGYITGVRFYKSSSNTGTHLGNLWSSTGQLLATATFVNETASGWQQVTFGAPVPISANTTYVASYHTDTGFFAEDDGYFAASGVDAAPLHTLANGVDGNNGVYAYGLSAFPTSFYQSANYWVDVVFAAQVGSDVIPPSVIAVSPANSATGVALDAQVKATFGEALTPATVTTGTFEVRDGANNLVAATVSYDAATKVATLIPTSPLGYSARYTARLKGGTTEPRIKDLAGNALANDYVWSFTTIPPTPDDGPAAPSWSLRAAQISIVATTQKYCAPKGLTHSRRSISRKSRHRCSPPMMSPFSAKCR